MIEPVRLQLSRRRGFDLQAHSRAVNGLPSINFARPGRYGNPFVVGRHGNRKTCVELYAKMLDGWLNVAVDEACFAAQRDYCRTFDAGALVGHNLACWCKLPRPGEPDWCHAAIGLVAVKARSA